MFIVFKLMCYIKWINCFSFRDIDIFRNNYTLVTNYNNTYLL